MKPNKKADLYFYYLIQHKILEADEEGNIFEVSSKKKLNTGHTKGYRRLSYNNHGIQAHRFVWIYFNGLIPGILQINHKNGIKYDNRISNLELATNAQNTKHAYDIGLAKITMEQKRDSAKRLLGEKNINSKVSDEEVIKIRKNYTIKKLTIKDMEEKYGLKRRAAENLLLGRSYSHVPFEVKKLIPHRVYKNKLDIVQANNIRKLHDSGKYTQVELGVKFNVSRSTIRDVITYRTFKK